MAWRDLKLLDSYASVILAEAAMSLPYAVLFFTSFLKSAPVELEEAAATDGAGPLRTYRRVILPVLRPATATLVITLTLAIWNDLVIPRVLPTCDSKQAMALDATAHRRRYHRRGQQGVRHVRSGRGTPPTARPRPVVKVTDSRFQPVRLDQALAPAPPLTPR
ncbi:ABC transporter permease subunit [Streptomyces fodineus]|uniref:ABC transporter permease subunit n=1 Tax=Streptomyces fodineus TaxID=1904616 RepID=UPI00131CBEAC|nr:ABC transporter permease subunit [Streptomyces fodineus]